MYSIFWFIIVFCWRDIKVLLLFVFEVGEKINYELELRDNNIWKYLINLNLCLCFINVVICWYVIGDFYLSLIDCKDWFIFICLIILVIVFV